VHELHRLIAHAASKHTVREAVDVSQLIVPEDEQLPTPHFRLRRAVFDPVLETRHDSEVMACAFQSPHQIRVFGLRDGDCRTVGQHQACGYQIVSQES
jgi:hypothetical protein